MISLATSFLIFSTYTRIHFTQIQDNKQNTKQYKILNKLNNTIIEDLGVPETKILDWIMYKQLTYLLCGQVGEASGF